MAFVVIYVGTKYKQKQPWKLCTELDIQMNILIFWAQNEFGAVHVQACFTFVLLPEKTLQFKLHVQIHLVKYVMLQNTTDLDKFKTLKTFPVSDSVA